MTRSVLNSYLPFLIAVLAVTVLATGLQQQTDRVNLSSKRDEMQAAINILQTRLESQVESSVLITRGIGTLLSRDHDVTQSEFSQLVAGVVRGRNDVINVAWAPDLIITRVHPVAPNKAALGLDYRTVPDQLEDVLNVRNSGQITFVGPINLVQGNTGFIIRVPVYDRSDAALRFAGILSTVFDLNLFLSRAGLLRQYHLDLALVRLDKAGAQTALAFGNPDVIDDMPVSADIAFPGAKWRLYARPKNGWATAQNTRIYNLAILFALCALVLGPAFLLNRMALARTQMVTDMQTANARLDNFIQNFPGVFFTFLKEQGVRGRVVFATDAVRDMWGVSKEDLYRNPAPMWRGVADEARSELAVIMEQARLTGTTWRHVWEYEAPDGSQRWLEGWGHPYSLPHGSIRWECFVMDVTDQRLRDLELATQTEIMRQAQKQESIGQLTGGMAHDFNNMLAVIRGNLEMLEEDVKDIFKHDDEKMDFIRGSILAAEQGNDLTRKMLSFARRAPLNPEVFNLNDLVDELEGWSGRTLPATITLNSDLATDLLPITADRSSTASALLNLMVNARDAMPYGGTLTLATDQTTLSHAEAQRLSPNLTSGGYAVLSVRDTGEGIRPELLEKICEPFFTTKGVGEGSGLGLSMVHGFLAQSGGALDIQSELGQGTVVSLYFPSTDVPTTSFNTADTATNSSQQKSLHILLAEDHQDVRLMLERQLSRMGHRVSAAVNGDDAFACFKRSGDIDLLITDIVMPGHLQGDGLIEEIRKIHADFPVIVLSGYSDLPVEEGSALRANDIRLSKPVARTSLKAAVSLAMRGVM